MLLGVEARGPGHEGDPDGAGVVSVWMDFRDCVVIGSTQVIIYTT
jgi:hypothetical protein